MNQVNLEEKLATFSAKLYTGIFKDSRITKVSQFGEAGTEIHGRPSGPDDPDAGWFARQLRDRPPLPAGGRAAAAGRSRHRSDPLVRGARLTVPQACGTATG